MFDYEESLKIVAREHELFRAALPELLKTLKGRWVVYKDNAVQGDYATEKEAYHKGLDKYGLEGGFVIAQVVEEEEPEFLTASIAFGFIG